MILKVQIRDMDVCQVVQDLAGSFKVSTEGNNNECCVRIPNSAASGFVKGNCFPMGSGFLNLIVY